MAKYVFLRRKTSILEKPKKILFIDSGNNYYECVGLTLCEKMG